MPCLKAKAVISKVPDDSFNCSCGYFGGFIDHIILGKPQDSTEAKGYLRVLSGRRHSVYTRYLYLL